MNSFKPDSRIGVVLRDNGKLREEIQKALKSGQKVFLMVKPRKKSVAQVFPNCHCT